MKKRSTIAFAATLLLAAQTYAASYTDITVFDGLEALSPSGGGNQNGLFGATTDPRLSLAAKQSEFNEVENGNVEDPSWDLRAFGFDAAANKLIYQGGVNIAYEHSSNNQSSLSTKVTGTSQINSTYFGIGSIFIKLGPPSGLVEPPPIGTNDSTNGYEIYPNDKPTGGFDYAVTLLSGTQPGTLDYIIYDLNANSKLTSAYFGSNEEAGPYAFRLEDNSAAGSYDGASGVMTTSVVKKTSADIDAMAGNLQGFGVDNYIAELDLGSIPITNGTYFYLSQKCGNDLLVGQYFGTGTSLIVVPEPAGMAGLMGLLLSGAFLRSRRRA